MHRKKTHVTRTLTEIFYLGNSMGFMINDDRFLLGCLDHWEFGVDNTGNLLDLKNMEKIKVGVPLHIRRN